MGASTLKLSSWLTLLLTLSYAAVIKAEEEHVVLHPEHLCPCIEQEDCPRVWGTQPEDVWLGNFSACTEPGFVRCCGVKEHESAERSNESSEDTISIPEQNSDGAGSKPPRDRVIPPGIRVPVPFLFPEYLDYRTSTSTTTELPEIIPGAENGEDVEGGDESGEWVYVDEYSDEIESTLAPDQVGNLPALIPGLDEAGSKNIDNTVSQADNFVSSNSLDQRGVDKSSVTEGDVETTNGGKLSGNIRDEETSSSLNDDKKIEGIVIERGTTPSIVQLPDTKKSEATANEEKELSELPISTELETIEPSITPPESSDAGISQENEEDLEALNDSPEIAEPVTSQITESLKSDNSKSKNKGKTVIREETSTQKKTEKVTKESSNYNEKTSSLTTVYDDDDADDDEYDESYEIVDGTETEPTTTATGLEETTKSKGKSVNKGRTEVVTQKKSETAVKESSKVEEKSSSKVQSTILENVEESFELSDETELNPTQNVKKSTSFRRPAIGGGSKGKPSRGTQTQTTSEQKSETVKKESSNIEESKTSKVEKVITNVGDLSSEDSDSEILDKSAVQDSNVGKLVSKKRPSFGSKGQSSRVRERETITEKKSESSKKESSTIEESKSSSVQSTTTNNEKKSDKSSGTGSKETFVQKIENTKKESSSSEKISSSNIQTSKTEEVSVDGGNSKKVSKEEKKETSSNTEKNESTKKESSIVEKEISSSFKEPSIEDNATGVETIPLKIPEIETVKETESNKETGVPTEKEIPIVSTESPSTETSTSSSKLMNILAGKLPSNSGAGFKPNENGSFNKLPSKVNEDTSAMDKFHNSGVWQIANRPYVPVLINAGFLKDRPISTGPVGLDPLSGVTHSDIANAEVAPELLPLSCGNVIFGERFRDGKTLVCEIPQANEAPIRFLKENVSPVSQEKLRGPPLPGAILPAGILTSGDGVESPKSTKITANENSSRRPVRKRIVIKRPVPIATKEDILAKKLSTPKRSDSDSQKQVEVNVDDGKDRVVEAAIEIGSKQTTTESVSVSASSSWNSTSSQESVSTSDAPTETTKAKIEVTAEELIKADRQAQALNSKFYLLPLAPVLPRRELKKPTTIRPALLSREPAAVVETVSEDPTTTTPVVISTPEPAAVVKTVSEDPTTTTPVVISTPEPAKVVETVSEDPTTTTPVVISTPEPAKVVEVVSENTPRRIRVSKKRQRRISNKKRSSSDRTVASVKTSEDNQFAISDDNSGISTSGSSRNTRQIRDIAPNKAYFGRDVVSPDEISPTGRLDIVGPIPRGFYDWLLESNQPLLELPNQINIPNNFRGTEFEQKQSWDGSVTRKDYTFKPSPIDPINWQ